MSFAFFQQIDQLHSQCSLMDKATKVAYLQGQYQRLNSIVNNLACYIRSKGGDMTLEEKQYARKLLEMINSVDAEGAQLMDDLRKDALKEIIKRFTVNN